MSSLTARLQAIQMLLESNKNQLDFYGEKYNKKTHSDLANRISELEAKKDDPSTSSADAKELNAIANLLITHLAYLKIIELIYLEISQVHAIAKNAANLPALQLPHNGLL